MPFVSIRTVEGQRPETKERIIEAFAAAISNETIVFEDMPAADCYVSYRSVAKMRSARPIHGDPG